MPVSVRVEGAGVERYRELGSVLRRCCDPDAEGAFCRVRRIAYTPPAIAGGSGAGVRPHLAAVGGCVDVDSPDMLKVNHMTIELTPSQSQTLASETNLPHRVVDRRQNTAYVLIPETEYEALREILDDERALREIRSIGLRNAAARADDPL
jgi:hypothetical protein